MFHSTFHPTRIGATTEGELRSDLSPFEGCFARSFLRFLTIHTLLAHPTVRGGNRYGPPPQK